MYDIPVQTLSGKPATLEEHRGKAMLIVNVASRCGFTPQYEALQNLWEEYRDRGLVVLGFPCNQFGGQEPGSPEDIEEFCSTTFSVSFPMYEKCDVNGADRHPLFERLTELPDQDGNAGDVKWNFEKFVVSADGSPVARFGTLVEPKDPRLLEAIESALPG